jgi:hypothetical protein
MLQLMGLRRLFTDHPASVGESYLQHLCVAASFGAQMMLGAAACFLHAILPFAFRRTGSECIEQLHDRMVVNRHTHGARADRAGAVTR